MISVSHKFIFIHPQKTGGSSVANLFARHCIDGIRGACLNQEQWKPDDADNLFERYTARVFDPHQRLLEVRRGWRSEWGDYNSYRKIATVRNPYERAVSFYFDRNFGPGKPFEKETFKTWANKLPPLWEHLTLDLDATEKKWEMDNYIRLESMQEGVDAALEAVGLPSKPVPHVNKGLNPKPWRDFYDTDLEEFIFELFREDIERFGYEANTTKES